MLGAGVYPITLAEFPSYSEDADKLFRGDEHERLKEYLAFHPESGDVMAGTGGVRRLLWPFVVNEESREAQIVYFFRDLNMPLYLLAACEGAPVEFDDEMRGEMAKLVDELVQQHSKRWARQEVGHPKTSA